MTSQIIDRVLRLSVYSKLKWTVVVILLFAFVFSIPSKLFNAPTSYVLTDSDGNLLSASIASDGQWRFKNSQLLPDKFKQCIIAYEDKRFYYHIGIDPFAVCRAIRQNLVNKRKVSGASTINMQVIRLYRGAKDRNIWNKIIESVIAIRLEFSYRKESILALYAANAPFGSNVVGLEAAAWRYYGRASDRLSWGEMAALAVLPNAPSLVHPGKNRAELLRKRNDLMDRLYKNGTIDLETAALAKNEPLPGEPKSLPHFAPHLLTRFKKDFLKLKKENESLSTTIQTTIDGRLQKQVNNILFSYHQKWRGNQINNAAAMIVEVESGNILAYVGNVYNTADSSVESYVDVLSSVRSPGSTLKPILYASLLTDGSCLPKQLIPDIPTQINGYTPLNFDLGFDGAVPANLALAKSLNIPAVKMLQQYKYQRFYDVLKQAGITTLYRPPDFYGLSLILGGCEIRPFELAGVYSSIGRMYLHQTQNNGKWNQMDWHMPNYIKRGNRKNNSASEKALTNPLFDYTAMWHTLNAMNEVMRPGEEGLWNQFSSVQKIAWKTGTSFGFRDGWAIGLTPKYCVLVWVGNTTGEGRPDLVGIKTAAPALFEIFRFLPSSDWFETPSSGFTYLPVCHYSGFKAGNDCSIIDTTLVGETAIQSAICPYCRKINLDRTGNFRANESCETPGNMIQQSYFVLPPTMEYYYKQKHSDYTSLPPFRKGCELESSSELDIVYPDNNAKILVPKEITGMKGKTIFVASHKSEDATLFWHLDNTYIGSTQHYHQIALAPVVGKHIITIVDENGNSISRKFEIVATVKN